jgi:glycosyltransferase involved in cell wall biosynthesis
MKTLLLSIDDYVFYYKGKYYFDASTSIGMINRYLRIFDRIKLVARVEKLLFLPEGYNEIEIQNGSVNVIEIPFFKGLEVFKSFHKILPLVKNEAIHSDIAIVRMPSILGIIVIWVLRKLRIKFALEVVADPRSKSKNYYKKIIGFFFEKYLRKASFDAIGVAYVTNNYLQSLFPAKVGAFTSNYSSIELDDNYFGFPKEFPKNGKFKIIHLSLHIKSPSKGQDILLKVLKNVRDAGFDISVDFVGVGEYIGILKDLAKELGVSNYVNFLGYRSKKEVREILNSSDLMVFPSISEGMPRVIIEACALGLPCIASNVGGIPEILSKDVLFDQKDINGFSNKLIDILSSKPYYEELSKENIEMSRNFSKKNLELKRDAFYKLLKNNC